MKLPAYRKYKPSGEAWLPELPGHWNMASLRWHSRRYSGGTPDKGNEAYWEDGDIPWINSGAVNDCYITEPSALISRDGFVNSSAKWIPKGALVVALAGQGKTKGMVAQLGIATTCNQSMAAIIPSERLQPRYLYWWLSANYQNIRNMAGGEARDGLNLDLLGDIPCPLPSDAEQSAISAYLDRETTKIDALVSKKQELIERLREKRIALISRTVTRGLPSEAARAAGVGPNSKFKPAEVEWLGEVPEHWEITKGRFLGTLLGSAAPLEEDLIDDDDGTLFAKVDDLNYVDSALLLHATKNRISDVSVPPRKIILFPKRGAAIFTNKVVIVERPCLFDSNLMGWEIDASNDTRFVAYCLLARRLDDLADVSTVPQINNKHIYPAYFPRPPFPEQIAIAGYLDRETANIDGMVSKVESAIERLREYRAALITAAVTGKIDVREQSADNRRVFASAS